jgi:acyl dehydratase
MPVDRSFLGKAGAPVTMPIERGKIREFARAIKDDDPLYLDEEFARREAGGLLTPITFLQTIAHWDDGAGRPRPPFDLRRVLHGEQEFEFLAPIHAGDVLTAVSRLTDLYEKPGRRGGTMAFAVTETAFTSQRGTLVARARHVTIETGQVVEPETKAAPPPASGSSAPVAPEGATPGAAAGGERTVTRPSWDDVQEGDPLPAVRVEGLTRTDFVRYAGASGDFNPIHHDQTFAEASGNPTVFAMGMLNAGILSRVVTAYAGRPAVRRFRVRFETRAWPGDDVICTGRVTRKREEAGDKRVEGELSAVNQKGETLIRGSFVVALPGRESRGAD